MKLLTEFKKFAMRGNVLDMAVGIIIGAAFGKIVDSLVKDMIMPPLGILLGKIDFANLFFVLKEGAGAEAPYPSLSAAQAAGAVTLNLGMFLNTIISFTIVAFAVFMLIKAVNTLQAKLDADEKEAEASAPTTKDCPHCFSKIDIRAKKCPHCTGDIKK
ncbi:MAG: large-conductance mechanosensitive channel protein MscL [Alphaproteobacteria bacterium]|nr:large-conductance mechanosensitive channel protein MscL [Alphaproteobacteria bacterium]